MRSKARVDEMVSSSASDKHPEQLGRDIDSRRLVRDLDLSRSPNRLRVSEQLHWSAFKLNRWEDGARIDLSIYTPHSYYHRYLINLLKSERQHNIYYSIIPSRRGTISRCITRCALLWIRRTARTEADSDGENNEVSLPYPNFAWLTRLLPLYT